MQSNKKSGDGSFRMPLHYPRFTKKEYQDMPEWMVDRLLAEYGLSAATGDLAYKREFAMGAFLWPDFVHVPPPKIPKPSSVAATYQSFVSSLLKKKV